jgi:uncharacterized protein YceK
MKTSLKKLLIVLAVVSLSGCASTRVDKISVKATPNRQGKFDFTVDFYTSKVP